LSVTFPETVLPIVLAYMTCDAKRFPSPKHSRPTIATCRCHTIRKPSFIPMPKVIHYNNIMYQHLDIDRMYNFFCLLTSKINFSSVELHQL